MKQNDFYEVNGCTEFIPVTINETFADGVGVTVHSTTHPFRMMVKQVYRFPKQHEPQKVVVPKFVAEWIEDMKNAKTEFFEAQSNCMSDEVDDWYYNHADDLLRAWLFGYEVEKEKLYVVTDGNKLYLKKFEELNAVIIIDDVVGATDYAQHFVDKIKAQKAADELGWVVKEVEDER
ncbi:TPA: DUF1642 domain-containing protein [Streptococcus suis]|nr:DUF1642 domain-containing protein [Streptococcus suis]HEM2714266.1 DUF1642 domain-containing protein [Streptococcus suis]HEP1783031.1 DUF1642 domain-containing protein [Streptococcus suis]